MPDWTPWRRCCHSSAAMEEGRLSSSVVVIVIAVVVAGQLETAMIHRWRWNDIRLVRRSPGYQECIITTVLTATSILFLYAFWYTRIGPFIALFAVEKLCIWDMHFDAANVDARPMLMRVCSYSRRVGSYDAMLSRLGVKYTIIHYSV